MLFFWVDQIHNSWLLTYFLKIFERILIADIRSYNWFIVERYALYAPYSRKSQWIFFFLCRFRYRFTKLLKTYLVMNYTPFVWRMRRLFTFLIYLTTLFLFRFCYFSFFIHIRSRYFFIYLNRISYLIGIVILLLTFKTWISG